MKNMIKRVSIHLFVVMLILSSLLTSKGYATVNEDLLEAAIEGELSAVKKALNKGANINATGYGGKTALILAVFNEDADVAAFLIQKGADVNIKAKDGRTALMYAVEMVYPFEREDGNIELAKQLTKEAVDKVIKPLIEKGADVNIKAKDGRTALMDAAKSGNLEAAKILIQHGADVNAKDKDGSSVLMWARLLEIFEEEIQNCVDMFNLLIESGADVNAKNNNGETVLMRAQTEEVINILKKAGAK